MDQFEEDIKSKLLGLSRKARIIFGVSICERLFTNYEVFSKTFHFGNPDVLLEGISLIRQYLIDDSLFTRDEIEAVAIEIDSDAVTPDSEDFHTILVSFALDACTSVYSTLQYILSDDVDEISACAVYARDTVDMYTQERHDLDFNRLRSTMEQIIDTDPFMVAEKTAQWTLLERLKSLPSGRLSDAVINDLIGEHKRIDLTLLSRENFER